MLDENSKDVIVIPKEIQLTISLMVPFLNTPFLTQSFVGSEQFAAYGLDL